MMTRRTGTVAGRRAGFTLIEMLVVILIILLLVGLLIPVVFKVQDSAKRAETQWQMNQIAQAADLFTSSAALGGGSSVKNLPAPPFRLRPTYLVNGNPNPVYDPETTYLKAVWPNLNLGATGLPDADLVDGNQVTTFFLTGGTVTNFAGFATNSQQPFLPATVTGEKRIGPFLTLKDSLYTTNPGGGIAQNGQAWLIDSYRSPLAIFISGKAGNYRDGTNVNLGQSFTFNGSTVRPYVRSATQPLKYENPKGIQIISAGQDKTFGPGTAPPSNAFVTAPAPSTQLVGTDWSALVDNKNAMDDVSNFSTTNLGYGPQ